MIQLRNVVKRYNRITAVDDISFEVQQGETVVLLGTSGCGKTTTLRMINKLETFDQGAISINGTDIKQQPAELLRRGIGYVLQHHGLFPHYTIGENIAIVPKLLKWDNTKIQNRIEELLVKLKLDTSILSKYPSQLSGGQQQRIGLARALAANPPILLMDEPLGALDPITRSSIRQDFTNLDELKKKTIVMVTHDVQEAFELGDRICIMNHGKIEQIGQPFDLLFKPASAFVSSFLHQQRLQLELETITIKDIWNFLPKAIDKVEDILVDTSHNIWKLLESLPSTTDYVASINNDNRRIDAGSLMQAFTHYKNVWIHG